MPFPPAPARSQPRALLQFAIVIGACAAMFWPLLGHAGFGSTEGHRVAPAWEMLEGSDPWLPHMFDRVYLRKPPGMAWAIAASSAVFGRTEFAARAVSAAAASLSAVLALYFGRRWFGPFGGLAAGLAQALLPVWFSFARSAEIESLHTLACQASVLLSIDLLVRPRGGHTVRAVALALSLAAAGLIKGPAGLPALIAAPLACAAAARSWRGLASAPFWTGVGLGAAALSAAAWTIATHLRATGQTPVLQETGEFLPTIARIPMILKLLPAAILQGLPVCGAVVFALWPSAEREVVEGGSAVCVPPDAAVLARALAFTFLLSILLLMIGGVSNPRYALPALVPLAPLAGYMWVGRLGMFNGVRLRIVNWAFLGRLWAWPSIAVVLSLIYIFVFYEPRRVEVSGRAAGFALAAALPDDCDLFADWLIEARPDVLLYAQSRASELGKHVRVRWCDLTSFVPPPAGLVLVAVRDDQLGNEMGRPGLADTIRGWRPVFSGTVYKYTFDVLERTPPAH